MNPIEKRPKQSVPAEITSDLLNVIRGQFYPDAEPKRWHQDKNFILREVILWPASWLNKRGVSLPPPRYKAIILGVFQGIKQHGSAEAVKFWPGYLKHCVQEHFKHHGDEIYDEAKALRASLDKVLKSTEGLVRVDPIRVLAEARGDLLKARRQTRPKAKPASQMDLFSLLLAVCIPVATALQAPAFPPQTSAKSPRLAQSSLKPRNTSATPPKPLISALFRSLPL